MEFRRNTQPPFLQRLFLVALLLILLLLALIIRLIDLQLRQHKRYTTLSQHNQFEVISLPPSRGLIYDRKGVLLAKNIPVFALEVTPNRVAEINGVIQGLRKILPIRDEEIKSFRKQLHQHRPFQPIPIRMNLSERERAIFAVNRHLFPGVNVTARFLRYYPLGPSFTHILGYVGRINEAELKQLDAVDYSGTNFIGKLGIERFYEERLHGHVGYEQAEVDATGQIIRVLHRRKPIQGDNLYLTIDSKLQTIISNAMGHHRGAVVAMVPQTGDILAMISSPSFDPNPFTQGISQKAYSKLRHDKNQPLFNRAIRGQYPLASTIKPFLAIKALEDEIVTPKTEIWDKGYFQLPNSSHIYHDWKPRGHGWVNLQKAITVSCDTYFYALANKMGIQRIESILTQFGFGQHTHIDLRNELPGLIPNPQWKKRHKNEPWYRGDTLISGIGQGFMLTTPLQLVAATAALATHGIRIQPHLLYQSKSAEGQVKTHSPIYAPAITLSDEYIWDYVTHAMENVINHHHGTGFRFGRDTPYRLAAKTGTGQVVSTSVHGTTKNSQLPERLRDHSMFIAFAPVEKPRIAIAIIVENRNIASNIARRVLDFYLLGKTYPNLKATG